jgi:tripartite-type tricarboxylate transporter receptor subunit TctC
MRSLFALLAVVYVGIGSAHAQGGAQIGSQAGSDFPSKPVRLVVPFPAGGPTDLSARVVAQKLGEAWGKAVIIENRPGADTIIGAQAVARAEPDGHTLLVAADSTLAMNQFTHRDLPYDPQKDFAPITLLFKNTTLLVVRFDGAATVSDLIAKARANPGKLNYGAGLAANRLAGYVFVERSGIDVQFIAYKGGGDLATALLNGSLDFSVDSVAANLPLIQTGKLRALAKISSSVRLPALPELQSLAVAARMPDLEDISTWGGLVAPAGTPRPIIDQISRDVTRAYADPAVVEKLQNAGIGATAARPAEFDAFIRAEAKRWQEALKNGKLKLD